jgi:uncharacterized protein (TIGR01319 family)
MLAVDVGEINTRAVLFDVVEGRYRFLAIGIAPTTARPPVSHVGEGVLRAIDELEEITGRRLIGENNRLIVPERNDAAGVDVFLATLSAGPPLQVFTIGLLEDISLRSAGRLVSSTYGQVVGSVSLNDHRKPEERLDAILHTQPDLIVIAGGIERGAASSLLRLVESVRLACSLMPMESRPEVFFAGNQALAEHVRNRIGQAGRFYQAPNVRPAIEVEQLAPARAKLVEVFRSIRSRQLPGVSDLVDWSGKRLLPTASAFGRVVRFLSKVYGPAKGVLGVDVGASATTIAAAFGGDLHLGVYPQFGLGSGVTGILEGFPIEAVTRWLAIEVSQDYVRDYLYNKAVYPASLPATPEDLAIEHAVARQAIRAALVQAEAGFPRQAGRAGVSVLPWFEPILASGSVLTRAPSIAHSLLILLDAIQPAGITTLVLDQNSLAPALGAASSVNPILAVQILESPAFLSLATVVSPVAQARPGTPILHIRVTYESGEEIHFDVKQGALEALPLPQGQSARLRLQPLHRADIGMGGPGRGGSVRVVGGALGVVIDARGRPLHLPVDLVRRRELYKKWLWTLGG